MEIDTCKDDYLCVEIAYQGKVIPSHEQSILPSFVWKDEQWIPSRNLPFPGMIGCKRKVNAKIGFLGDSITQGIGTTHNSYKHWCALVAEEMGDNYSYWNLGLGFGRAQDIASDGAWLFKAKQLDYIVLCIGTNDIGKQRDEEIIKQELLTIILKLKQVGIKILIQTLPPFSWRGEELQKWKNINQYIKNTLSKYTEGVFDVAPLLTEGVESEGKARYGGHPDEKGCRIWADVLTPVLDKLVKGEK